MESYEILCYGDSNTWGTVARCDAASPELRFDRSTRWPCVLQKELGEGYAVTEEGMGFRTTIYTNDLSHPWWNGLEQLEPTLHSHHPLDLAVVMLGTNDIRQEHLLTPEELRFGISRIVEFIQSHPEYGRDNSAPKVLIVAPPFLLPAKPEGRTEVYALFHGVQGEALSRRFPAVYRSVAEQYHCGYVNAQSVTVPDPADGVHIDGQSHLRLAHAITEEIQRIRREL